MRIIFAAQAVSRDCVPESQGATVYRRKIVAA